MLLIRLEKNLNTVCVLPSVLDELACLPANMQAHARAMKTLFKRYAAGGRQGLTSQLFHEADKQHGVWEFIHGRVRVFCFMDQGALIVLTAVAIKKTQKADAASVNASINAKQRYLEAKRCNALQIQEITEETT
ncbi:MAG: type II toxin-antitoxin system RelE/ParE family toxin [Halothiobacillaceae bacterium]